MNNIQIVFALIVEFILVYSVYKGVKNRWIEIPYVRGRISMSKQPLSFWLSIIITLGCIVYIGVGLLSLNLF